MAGGKQTTVTDIKDIKTLAKKYGVGPDTVNGVVTGYKITGGVPQLDVDREPYYIYVDPSGAINPTTGENSARDVRKRILDDINALPGGIDGFFNLLYSKNFINEATYKAKDISSKEFNTALFGLLNRAGVDAIDKFQISGRTEVPTFIDYIASLPTYSDTKSGTTLNRNYTLRPDADEEAIQFFRGLVGRAPTNAEKDAYYAALHKAEQKAVVTTTVVESGTVANRAETGSLISETDKYMMLGKIAGKALNNTNLEVLLKSGSGAAQDVNSLKTYANQYGITYTDDQARDAIVDNLLYGKTLDSKKAKILKLSKIKYSNLADQIDEDTSVEDIASETMQIMAKSLGIPYKSLTVNHPVITQALANEGKPGIMSNHGVQLLIRNSPETRQQWLKSPNAMEEASAYATNILKTFGLM